MTAAVQLAGTACSYTYCPRLILLHLRDERRGLINFSSARIQPMNKTSIVSP